MYSTYFRFEKLKEKIICIQLINQFFLKTQIKVNILNRSFYI